MMPQLILTQTKKKAAKYINDFVKKNHVPKSAIFIYEMEGTVVTIDQVREIQSLFDRIDPTRKLVVMYDFDTAREPTQNALLKTIEEKATNAQFIIVAKTQQSILDTIVSRCCIVRLTSDFDEKKEIILSTSLSELLTEFTFAEKNTQKTIDACDSLLLFFKKKLQIVPAFSSKTKHGYLTIPSIIKEILHVRNVILRNNVGGQVALDHLLVFIQKRYKE